MSRSWAKSIRTSSRFCCSILMEPVSIHPNRKCWKGSCSAAHLRSGITSRARTFICRSRPLKASRFACRCSASPKSRRDRPMRSSTRSFRCCRSWHCPVRKRWTTWAHRCWLARVTCTFFIRSNCGASWRFRSAKPATRTTTSTWPGIASEAVFYPASVKPLAWRLRTSGCRHAGTIGLYRHCNCVSRRYSSARHVLSAWKKTLRAEISAATALT
ncbi:hypothetical protein ALQ59_200177 [Pseudomonas syringae pv. apii]|nr:hypothetical protein ALQ59_200177 [Pseudomonas syringae pv. apii]